MPYKKIVWELTLIAQMKGIDALNATQKNTALCKRHILKKSRNTEQKYIDGHFCCLDSLNLKTKTILCKVMGFKKMKKGVVEVSSSGKVLFKTLLYAQLQIIDFLMCLFGEQ